MAASLKHNKQVVKILIDEGAAVDAVDKVSYYQVP